MNSKADKQKITPCVLISVDGSRPSFHAVDYVASLTRLIPALRFVLLYVLPQPPQLYTAEAKTDGQMRTKLKKLEQANRETADGILEKARQHLLDRHIEAERIETRVRKRHSGLAKDIINQIESGHFDALVVGRRGLTRTQELFMGSVSNQLVQHAAGAPLWIIDGKVTQPKVLVAVDGSEASLRAVDHVAFMLGSNPEAEVDFLHVVPKLQNYCAVDFSGRDEHWAGQEGDVDAIEQEFRREDDVCINDFLLQAVRILQQAGFSQERIKIEERETTLGIARTIIKAALDGGYGTIVIGRRGLGRSSFLGSVSDRVIRRAEDLAIWLVN